MRKQPPCIWSSDWQLCLLRPSLLGLFLASNSLFILHRSVLSHSCSDLSGVFRKLHDVQKWQQLLTMLAGILLQQASVFAMLRCHYWVYNLPELETMQLLSVERTLGAWRYHPYMSVCCWVCLAQLNLLGLPWPLSAMQRCGFLRDMRLCQPLDWPWWLVFLHRWLLPVQFDLPSLLTRLHLMPIFRTMPNLRYPKTLDSIEPHLHLQ